MSGSFRRSESGPSGQAPRLKDQPESELNLSWIKLRAGRNPKPGCTQGSVWRREHVLVQGIEELGAELERCALRDLRIFND